MIRKIIFRVFIGCIALFLLAVAGVAYSVWLVQQEPSFYAELRQQTFTSGEQKAAEERLELMGASIEHWIRTSVKRQNNETALPVANGTQPARPKPSYDPSADERSFRFSQDDLNAVLSSRKNSSGDLQDIRIQVLEDRIRLAGEVVIPDTASLVLSADFRLSKAANNKLKLEIVGGSIGQLPVPLSLLLRSLPDDTFQSDKDVEVRFSDPAPHLLLNVANSNYSTPVLKEIQMGNGNITLQLAAPVVSD